VFLGQIRLNFLIPGSPRPWDVFPAGEIYMVERSYPEVQGSTSGGTYPGVQGSTFGRTYPGV